MPIDRTCEWCGKHFAVKPSVAARGAGRCCSRHCARSLEWVGRPEGTGYRGARMPDHPLASPSGNVRTHRVILFEHIGPGPHPCHWCGAVLHWMPGQTTVSGALLVDHVDGNKRNNAPDNLVPTCHRCNVWRNPPSRNHGVPDDELFLVQPDGRRYRAVKVTCEWCGTEFLRQKTVNTPGYGRFCSHSCSARSQHAKRREAARD